MLSQKLWFDVEKKNYTTDSLEDAVLDELWFDVEKKNYTTMTKQGNLRSSCGLM